MKTCFPLVLLLVTAILATALGCGGTDEEETTPTAEVTQRPEAEVIAAFGSYLTDMVGSQGKIPAVQLFAGQCTATDLGEDVWSVSCDAFPIKGEISPGGEFRFDERTSAFEPVDDLARMTLEVISSGETEE